MSVVDLGWVKLEYIILACRLMRPHTHAHTYAYTHTHDHSSVTDREIHVHARRLFISLLYGEEISGVGEEGMDGGQEKSEQQNSLITTTGRASWWERE